MTSLISLKSLPALQKIFACCRSPNGSIVSLSVTKVVVNAVTTVWSTQQRRVEAVVKTIEWRSKSFSFIIAWFTTLTVWKLISSLLKVLKLVNVTFRPEADIKVGNVLPLANIPVGTLISRHKTRSRGIVVLLELRLLLGQEGHTLVRLQFRSSYDSWYLLRYVGVVGMNMTCKPWWEQA